jgi:hypothetical protein
MKRSLLPVAALAIALAAAGCARDEGPAPPPIELAETWEGYGSQTAVLFFAEGGLDPVWREELRAVELKDDPVDRIERALGELLRGPEEGAGRAFPAGMELEHVFLEEQQGLLTLNFSAASAALLTRAGSLEERIALEALRRCLRVNFPAVRRLRILVGGEPTESLGGHLSLSEPLSLDESVPSLAVPPAAAGLAGDEDRDPDPYPDLDEE